MAAAALASAILFAELSAAGLGGQRGGRGMRGGRRARAERQEARSRRLVTVRLGAHGCVREPGGQASAPLNPAPGTWAPRRRCPGFHPHERPAHPAGLSLARAAEIQLSVQGQDRNSASRVSRTGNFSLTRCCPSPTPGFKTKQKPSASNERTQPGPAAAWATPASGPRPREWKARRIPAP